MYNRLCDCKQIGKAPNCFQQGTGLDYNVVFVGSKPTSRTNLIKKHMNKPTANYKMSKPLKTSLALGQFKNKDQKAQWKRAMIDAEIEAAKKPKATKGDRQAS